MSVMGRLVSIAAPFGVFALSRMLTRRAPRVLMYHRFSAEPEPGAVSASALEWQLAEIARHYHTFTMAEAIQHYYEGNGLPPNSVVITIDDGYRDFYDVAWPLFKKHGVKATLYVTTGFIDGDTWLWPDRLSYCLQHGHFAEPLVIGEISIPAGRLSHSLIRRLRAELNDMMLSVPDEERLRLLATLDQIAGVNTTGPVPEQFAPCTWDALREMQAEGLEIGGHTVTHPSLGRVSPEQARTEIEGCWQRMTEMLGRQARSFCYPNGQPDDYVPETLNYVKEAGFVGAVTAFHDDLNWQNRYAIRRFSGCEERLQFRKALHGVEWLSNRGARRVLGQP